MKIVLHKYSEKTLNQEITHKQINYAVRRILGGSRGNTWTTGKVTLSEEEIEGKKMYTATIPVKRTGREISHEKQLEIVTKMQELAESSLRSKGWTGKQESKVEQKQATPEDILLQKKEFFSHLYGLDAQITQILSSVKEYVRSDFNNRFHCCLYGAPACGKTECLRALSNMVGRDNVLHFDATSTTAAGAKQLLLEAPYVPPILCIEEIEKADETSLRWLLGILDYRAEVRSVKFRQGVASRQVKLLCLATVNDLKLFQGMMDGALASRFSHHIWCPRPSRDVLNMILEREIEKNNGKVEWIKPALDWCIDHEDTNDPRRVITVCLCGRNKLMTGEYQKMLKLTAAPNKKLSLKETL